MVVDSVVAVVAVLVDTEVVAAAGAAVVLQIWAGMFSLSLAMAQKISTISAFPLEENVSNILPFCVMKFLCFRDREQRRSRPY